MFHILLVGSLAGTLSVLLSFVSFFVGMAVAVKYEIPNSDSGPWYRGQITQVIDGKGTVDVFLVDYGTQVTLSWANVRKLQLQFFDHECVVMFSYCKCSINNNCYI